MVELLFGDAVGCDVVSPNIGITVGLLLDGGDVSASTE
jgi:hypothetical protein